MKRYLPFSVALIGTAALAAGHPTVRSLRELNELPDADFAQKTAFCATGTVIASIHPFGSVIEDDGIRLKTYISGKHVPVPGDRIAFEGHTSVTKRRARFLTTTNWLLIRHTDQPEPESVTIRQIHSGRYNLQAVTTTGTVTEFFLDNLDERFAHIFLSDDGQSLDVGIRRQDFDMGYLRSLVNARISVRGTCVPNTGGWRMLTGPILLGISEIKVLEAAPRDPFGVPALPPVHHLTPSSIAKMGRRCAVGKVCATWRGDRVLISTDDGSKIRVQLAEGQRLPTCGEIVRVVGLVDTDTANIMLTSALWRQEAATSVTDVRSREITPQTMAQIDFHSEFDGQLVSIRGTVIDMLHQGERYDQLIVDCYGHAIPVDVSSIAEKPADISAGCKLKITGTFLAETDTWSRNAPFPRFKDFIVIPRDATDIEILSQPPWWTPGRLFAVIGALLALIVAILIRNGIQRRNAALLARLTSELKVAERTRLAVELHDSIAQSLTGVALEVNTADRSTDTDPVKAHRHLGIAAKSLKSCRDELRYCLWDLRNSTLENADMNEAIRQTLAPHLGDTRLSVRFTVPRDRISDNTAHAILRIVRELTVNAIRHGLATDIKVAGSVEDKKLLFSVRDNGRGFDPANAPGVAQGHYGLLGIRERVEGFEGDLEIESAPGQGTRVTIRLNIPQEHGKGTRS